MNTGIRRKVDDLGRVVIPASIRRTMNIREGDEVEVAVDGDRVYLAKPIDQCVFCGSDQELRPFRERRVCRTCLAGLAVVDETLRVPREEPAADGDGSRLPPWPLDDGAGKDAPHPRHEEVVRAVEHVAPPHVPHDDRQEPPASTTAW